jgi:hypothetical protein
MKMRCHLKKFILGLILGLAIACSSVAFASGSIQALLFPTSFEINGSNIALNNDYKVLNVDGHAYVPIRFIAENLGGTIDYDAELQKIFVKNSNLDLTDPDYKGISVGNLILTKVGNNTRVTGQLRMEGVGNSKNMIGANLSFYNDKSEKIGDVAIKGNDFGVESQMFVLEGSGDFRAYSAVNLHIGAVNNNIISEAQNVIYENTKLGFTLKLPKSWEGKYDVVEGTDFISFINISNKEAGWGGVLFTIQIWSKEKWNTDGAIAKQNIHISKIGERGDEIFTLSTPTDVNYNVNDEKMKAEYASMWDHINTIKTTFKIKKNLTENEVKDILNELIPKATAIYGMFNGTGWFKSDATKTIPGEDGYTLVVDENVKSVADLKKVIEDVFTKDIVQKLFYSRYLETKDIGLPLYEDYQGLLYVNTRNGGHGWAEKFLIDTAKIKSQRDNVVEIELDTTVLDNPGDKVTIRIENVNDKWLMATELVK